jgi:hypothetical protein
MLGHAGPPPAPPLLVAPPAPAEPVVPPVLPLGPELATLLAPPAPGPPPPVAEAELDPGPLAPAPEPVLADEVGVPKSPSSTLPPQAPAPKREGTEITAAEATTSQCKGERGSAQRAAPPRCFIGNSGYSWSLPDRRVRSLR